MHATFLRSLTVLAPKSLPGTSLPVHARCEPATTFFKMSLHSVGKRYMSVTFWLVTTMSADNRNDIYCCFHVSKSKEHLKWFVYVSTLPLAAEVMTMAHSDYGCHVRTPSPSIFQGHAWQCDWRTRQEARETKKRQNMHTSQAKSTIWMVHTAPISAGLQNICQKNDDLWRTPPTTLTMFV